jgi:hypothetical protein
MDVVISVSGVPIRLTDERWEHVVLRHPDFALRREEVVRTIREPEIVVEGGDGEHLAIRRVRPRWIVVAYRETSPDDGFVVTAFISDRDPALGRTVLWIAS